MTKDAHNRMQRIYRALDESQAPIETALRYELSKRNSPKDNELRGFLLEIHGDKRLASFVGDRKVVGSPLYDPNPNSENAWYLSWEEKDDKVNFVYQQPTWGMGHGGRHIQYELVDGRFYAQKKELLDHFPELTASKLEEGIKKAFEEERKFRAKRT